MFEEHVFQSGFVRCHSLLETWPHSRTCLGNVNKSSTPLFLHDSLPVNSKFCLNSYHHPFLLSRHQDVVNFTQSQDTLTVQGNGLYGKVCWQFHTDLFVRKDLTSHIWAYSQRWCTTKQIIQAYWRLKMQLLCPVVSLEQQHEPKMHRWNVRTRM